MADNLIKNNNHESEDFDMTKIRDYNMNGTIILGVDAGYGNYKTARCCFPTSVSRSDQPPIFTRNFLEYDGGYYTIGEGHKDFVAEKSMDDDNYILTLAAIAKELKARELSTAKIHLAVGLPLKWVQAQRDSFREYMLQNRHVDYKYAGKHYAVDIVDCTVMPQCYAAIAENLPDFKGMHMIADIGNGTMNVMILNNGKASESKSWTVKLGANECFMAIRNLILDRKAEEVPAEIIENYLRYGDTKVGGEYQQLMEEAAKSYVDKIFAERKRLDQPEEKTATRNMFYDEQGKHVRTKKEILDGDGNIRKGCKIIKKGEVYERRIFTIKDIRFKQESFLDEAKVFYTDLINQMVVDNKDRLSIFDKNGPYLATKKVGKNNPKAEAIKAGNEIRMEWNNAVDRAIVSGISETEVVELKKTEITDRVKESVEQNGKKPELFWDIVRAAVALLERLIAKAMQKVMDIAEKVIDKAVDAIKDTSKEMGSPVHAKDDPTVQPEKKKIPFPVNPQRKAKADVRNETEQIQFQNAMTVKKSVIEQIKAKQKSVSAETKQLETERLQPPKTSILASKYPHLKEIDSRLKEQNKAIYEREKKRNKLKKELSECVGIFKSGRRKELQQEIDSIDNQIFNMKKRLSSIVKEYKFDSVQAFYKELNAAKKEYLEYQAARAEDDKIYGDKATNTLSIRDRIRQKEQMIKEREAVRVHQARQKDKGAR